MTVELLSKISLKSIGAQPTAQSIKNTTALAHVYGSARGFSVGVSNYGTYIRFDGEFEAVNLMTGEVFKSAKLLMPDIFADMLQDALIGAGAEGGKIANDKKDNIEGRPTTTPVDFAIELLAKPSEKGSTGYTFTCRPLTPFKASDAISHLRDTVKAIAHQQDDKQAAPKLDDTKARAEKGVRARAPTMHK